MGQSHVLFRACSERPLPSGDDSSVVTLLWKSKPWFGILVSFDILLALYLLFHLQRMGSGGNLMTSEPAYFIVSQQICSFD